MSEIATGAVNHLDLTVADLDRSRDFYVQVLGFQFVMQTGPKYLLSNGEVVLALNESPDPSKSIDDDRFDENRIGLDHVSFNVGSMAALREARDRLEALNISHGEIKDLGPLGISVLAFRDPDNIQLELTAQNE